MVCTGAVSADVIFIYSSVNQIYGINLTTQEDSLLTTASLSPTVNALATNSELGLVYYGDNTSIYYWDPALGAGAGAHVLINNFQNGLFQAPIHNINSTGGSFLDGKYYLGSEDDNGFVEEVYELGLSADGRQITSLTPLGINNACNCTKVQLGGFGDIAVVNEGGIPVMYGSTADLTNNGSGTHAGIWRFDFLAGNWSLLNEGFGGQMSNAPSGQIYTNIGNSVREINTSTGAISNQSLMTTSAAIWDFTGAFSFDFGDAADSYGAAIHLVDGASQSVYLGQTAPDNEAYTQNSSVGSSNGVGDNQNGVNDEDALSVLPELTTDDSEYEISLQCSGGYTVAWIDFNLNGQFDFDERNSNHPVACTGPNTTLSWSGINNSVAGESVLRIRAAADVSQIYKPTGFVESGEVEDYNLTIKNVSVASGNCPAGSVSHVFSSTDVPINYSGNTSNLNTSVLTVPDSLLVTDVNVLDLRATHTSQRRLYFYLEKNGSYAYLYGNTCRSNTSLDVSFDDEAGGNPSCLPQSGQSYQPTGQLSQYDGIDAQGDWKLHVYNLRRSNSGSLDNWSLEICAAGQVSTTPDIRLGKLAEVDESTVTMTFALENTGDVPLSQIVVSDNLDAVFGQNNYSVSSAPQIVTAPAGFSINTSYTGQAGLDVIGFGSNALQVGESITFSFIVDVDTTSLGGNTTFENQAVVSAQTATGTTVSDESGPGLNLQTDTDAATNFIINAVVSISGTVFNDTSENINTAHDSIQQTNEIGIPGRAISIVDVASGAVIATTVTGSDGTFSVPLDPNYVGQAVSVQLTPTATTQFISESPVAGSGVLSDGLVEITPVSNSNLNVVNFGLIEKPTLQSNQSDNINAGASISYFHAYVSPSHGQVDFSLNVSNSSPGDNWIQALYVDANCNQQIDSSESVFPGLSPVSYQEQICLAILLTSPSNASAGATQSIDLQSMFYPSDVAQTGHNVVMENSNTDFTTVVDAAAGNLELQKTVTNLTLGGLPVEQNNALPGHVLEYSIRYENTGAGNVVDLEINDAAPAFTQIVPLSTQCGATPAGLSCSPNQSGDTVNWVFQGALAPNTTGVVTYRVLID